AILAPPLCAWLLIAHGWRATFLFTGLLGVVWLIAWLVATRGLAGTAARAEAAAATDAPSHAGSAGAARDGDEARRSIANGRSILAGLMIARAVADPAWYFYLFWLPDYLSRVRGFSLAEIGAFAWIPYVTANIG